MGAARARLGLFGLSVFLLWHLFVLDAVWAQDGMFFIRSDLMVGAFPLSVIVGDFNGDGRDDVAASRGLIDTGIVSIRLGREGGSFEGAPNVGVGARPGSMAVGDFNGDGHVDLATGNRGDATISIRLGQGDGNFAAAPDVEVGANPLAVAVGDFNGDGRLDLATTNGMAATVSIRLGQGDGNFAAAPDVEVGANPLAVAVGDFNGDGRLDLATSNLRTATVSIRLGQGDGSFDGVPDIGVGGRPLSITVGDFNGDGHQDLATSNTAVNTVSIRLGLGDGSFDAIPDVGVGAHPLAIAAGDFNGDGRTDLATANFTTDTASILINKSGVVVNDLVAFDPVPSTFNFVPDPTGCPAGFMGIFSFEARLTNASESSLTDLVMAVTTLSNGALLQNADGGPGGIGAGLTVPHLDGFADGVLSPDEFVDVPFFICLMQQVPFQFVVDVFGEVE